MKRVRQSLLEMLSSAAIPLITVGAVAIRLVMFVGVVRPDSFRYAELSYHVLHGGSLFDEAVFFASSRLTLMGPLLGFNAAFGYGELATVMWPLLCSVGTVLVAGLLGTELFDRRVGILAAFATAIIPLELEVATALLPDAVEGFFVVLAIYLGVLAVRRDHAWRILAVLSGVALGLAYFTRVNALVFLPGVLAIGVFIERKNARRMLHSLLGLAAVLLSGALIFYLLSGDPLVDWHRSGSFFSAYAQTGFVDRAHPFWWSFRYESAFKLWFYPSLVVGLVGALVRRGRAKTLLVVWVLGFWFYLDIISGWHGLSSAYRYAEPLVVPIVILASSALFDLSDRLPLRAGRMLVVAAVVAGALIVVPASSRHTARFARNGRWLVVRSVAEKIADSQAPVWVDDKWILISLNYYSGFAFDRDTLELPAALMNRNARLFTTEEAEIPAEGPAQAVLVQARMDEEWRIRAEQPYQGGSLVWYERHE